MLKNLEKRFRTFRDDKLIGPLVRSRYFQKHYKTNDDAAILDFGDHCIAFDPNDAVAEALRNNHGLDRDQTLRVFEALPKRGGVFVDVGANIGTQTVYALKFGGFEQAACFEPHPKNAWLLRANIALNGLSARATVIEAAAGAKAGIASLSVSSGSGTHSLAYRSGMRAMTVPVVSVGEELHKAGIKNEDIGLAWIDVEGYEGEVLKGWSLTAPLCIEYTPEVNRLPSNTFSGRSKWADARAREVHWRPIAELDLASYTSQQDLLLI